MNRRERLNQREAAKTLTDNAKGRKVDPVKLEQAKATAADHYAAEAARAQRESES